MNCNLKVFNEIPTHFEYQSTILTIGIFDGVHLGHQEVIKGIVLSSLEKQSTSVVLTFDPHPRKVLFNKELLFLSSLEDKIESMNQLGVQVFISANFTNEISILCPEDFVKRLLVEKLKMKEIWIGADFRFGKERLGNIELLKKMGQDIGFDVHVVMPVKVGNEIVSSTKIRNYLSNGGVQKAALLLGRYYYVKGNVISGEKRGNAIVGYPTANIEWEKGILIPCSGVYVVEVTFENKRYSGIANLGYNPTFNGKKLSFEIYLFDFNQDIHSVQLRVAFIKRLRDEKKFASANELSTQIKMDEELAKKYLNIKFDKLIKKFDKKY